MAITDQQVLSEIQLHLQETPADFGVTWYSGQWTAAEVLNYLNYRQYRFLKETYILLKRATVSVLPNTTRQNLPTDWVCTQRCVWQANDGSFVEIPRGDGWEADHALVDWPYNQGTRPQIYTDGEVPTLQIETIPASNQPGAIGLLYAYQPTLLTGAGTNFTVPDEFVPAIKWGTISDMLAKVGRAHDPERAAYCEQRFNEGVQAAQIMLNGWM